MHVHPDRVDAEALRRHDFPFQIVADHPGIPGGDAEHVQRSQIGALFGLAETVLALDLMWSKRWVNSKRSTLARCMSAAPLVTSASLTPSAFSRSIASCVPGRRTSSPRDRW